MRDNPPSADEGPFALPDHRVLALGGRDATTFAHAQFMNDVTALPAGHWQWNGWLAPKGRVIALFALLKLDVETLWLLLPDVDPSDLAAKLQRFVFRSKVAIALRKDCEVSGAFVAPAHARGAGIHQRLMVDAESVELDFSGDGGARTLYIEARNEVRHSTESANLSADVLRWTASDLAHGLPRLPASQADRWTPQQLSLDRLRAYSVKKGCYPGQEIVARTHFLGQAKRGLALFTADAAVAVGSEVRAGEYALGTVVSSAPGVEGHPALAVLPLERDDAPLSADGIALCERPLLGGLAR
ncbi:MAG: folate-binding protein [Luteimonas sp.]